MPKNSETLKGRYQRYNRKMTAARSQKSAGGFAKALIIRQNLRTVDYLLEFDIRLMV